MSSAVRVETKIVIALTLDQDEASYIQALVQNPYMYQGSDKEPEFEAIMRKGIFNSIADALGKKDYIL